MELFEDGISEEPFRNNNSEPEYGHSLHSSGIDASPKKHGFGLMGCDLYPETESNFDDVSKLEAFENANFDKDESFRLASDGNVTMSGSFISTSVENKASCEEQPFDDCASDFDLGGEGEDVIFDPDYVSYCGNHYVESRVSFSRSCIKISCKNISVNEHALQIVLEIEDIVKIESQWSAHFRVGTINIFFISKDAVEDDGNPSSLASGIQELVFPAADTNWNEKLEAIESLDEKYRALWTLHLDTGIEQPALTEQDDGLLIGTYFPSFDGPFEEVIYPQGEADAVSISKRDVEVLLPDIFLNDTIIDFYIKYLKTKQNVEAKTKFHFFNSFFFRKLADVDKDPSSLLDGKAAFLRVRKWTRKVKLDEKDFIFIPVNYHYHWSLVVICYFGEVSCYTDSERNKTARVPCILHMDSLRGTHAGLKDLFQSYLLEEWKERHGELSDDVHSKFRNLKFVPLELPQQQNSYDCGLFLLHYVELFLEGISPNFNIYNVTPCSKFLQSDWFPPEEASMKRTHIQRLISSLINTHPDNLSTEAVDEQCSKEPMTSNGYENDGKDPTNSHCWRDEGRLHQAEQGIEMTLLPASSTINQCARTSELVLSELLQPAVSHPSDGSAWQAFENSSCIDEAKRPPILADDDAECFVSTETTEPVFLRINGADPDTVDPNSSGGFMLESVCKTSVDGESSPVTSELLDAHQNNIYQESGYQNGNNLFFRSPAKFCLETEQLDANLISSCGHITASYSDEQQPSKRLRIPDLHENGENLVDEQASKRMRGTTLDCKPEDLHLNHLPNSPCL